MFNFMAAGRLPPVCEMKVSIFLIQDILFVAAWLVQIKRLNIHWLIGVFVIINMTRFEPSNNYKEITYTLCTDPQQRLIYHSKCRLLLTK